MNRIFILLLIFCFMQPLFAEDFGFTPAPPSPPPLTQLLRILQIAVEKQTGRGDTYDLAFSGSVGSLSVDLQDKEIRIVEFLNVGEVSLINTTYEITSLQDYGDSIDFDCVEPTGLTAGTEWRGKIWVTDYGKVMVEMVMKESPRKWVNLTDFGRKWLKDNNLNLNIGT